jgi:hypothetical protein
MLFDVVPEFLGPLLNCVDWPESRDVNLDVPGAELALQTFLNSPEVLYSANVPETGKSVHQRNVEGIAVRHRGSLMIIWV